MSGDYDQKVAWQLGEEAHEVLLQRRDNQWQITLGGTQHALRWQAEETAGLAKTLTLRLWLDQVEYRAQVLQDGDHLQVAQAGSDWTLAVVDTLASAGT